MKQLKTETIQVTAEHIKNGIPHDSRSCPIALSLYGKFGKRDYWVDRSMVMVSGGYYWNLPIEVTRFIDNFDRSNGNLTGEPFSFEFSYDLP